MGGGQGGAWKELQNLTSKGGDWERLGSWIELVIFFIAIMTLAF